MDPSMVQFSDQSPLPETHLPAGQLSSQGMAMTGHWCPHLGMVPEPGLVNTQLHVQLARQGHHSPQLQAGIPAGLGQQAGLPPLGPMTQARLIGAGTQLQQTSWRPMDTYDPQSSTHGPHYAGTWAGLSGFGLEDSNAPVGVTYPVPFAQNTTMDNNVQSLTLEKMRREIARLLTELDRAEREIVRQKGLRESERLEFTEAKDRLKHSWANDRDDFARVKSLLKTKNAEHHAQSGRLSQQLKNYEVCNRGLRELAVRHGLAIPSELEACQSRQSNSNFARHLMDAQPTCSSNKAMHDERVAPSGSSLDSYFQQAESEAMRSFPLSASSHPPISPVGLSLPDACSPRD